jgi:glucose-6-phosphate 1-dehydrogenase
MIQIQRAQSQGRTGKEVDKNSSNIQVRTKTTPTNYFSPNPSSSKPSIHSQ